MLPKLQHHATNAYMVTGQRGLGQGLYALHAAAAMLCENVAENSAPCGECLSCRKVYNGTHPDVIVYSKEKGKETYGAKHMRELADDVYITPNEGRRKIYIVPHTEDMTVQSQNVILKTLEEPPSNVTIILLVSGDSIILPTILSRVYKITLNTPSYEEAFEILKKLCEEEKEKAEASEQMMNTALNLSDNSVGLALDYIKDKNFEKNINFCVDFIEKALGKSEFEFIKLASNIEKSKESYNSASSLLSKFLIKIIYKDYRLPGLNPTLISKVNKAGILKAIEIITQTSLNVAGNANLTLAVTNMFIKCREALN